METQKTEHVTQRAVQYLDEIRSLMQLAGENPFKVRAYDRAVEVLRDRTDLEERVRAGTLEELPGIGKGIAGAVHEFIVEGKTGFRDEFRQKIPEGLIELTQIPGLGPKKAKQIIDELGIHTLGELEYACRENRILLLKGFGEKVQNKILEGIRFLKSTSGKARLSEALHVSDQILEELRKVAGPSGRVEEAGQVRRRLEVVDRMSFVCDASIGTECEKVKNALQVWNDRVHVPLELQFAETRRFGTDWVLATGSSEHCAELAVKLGKQWPDAKSEEELYHLAGLPWIPPEMREGRGEIALARSGKLANVLERVRGVFHNHTTESDGRATLEEMVTRASELGYEYIGISDHSQSAFYAHGLKSDRLREQEKAIREVQEKHPEIKVFWGVESDILQDGALDYTDAELRRFDFVIASIHSRFKMGRAEMTDRVLKAIRNPHTRMIGHLTGRLLLGRPAFELDIEKVIREAAEHDVAIEINANPQRLDIDWRWGEALRSCQTKVSVNPDAHDVAGLEDTRFGIMMARKALLPRESVVNSWGVQEVERWLQS